jgi:hypothetical protein
MEVLCRMFSHRRVAAADVTALQAHAQVNPGHAKLQTLFASSRVRFHILDEPEMGANWHNRSLRLPEAVRRLLRRNT